MNIREDTRKMLKMSGKTQKWLAKEAGVNLSSLSRYLGMKEPGNTILEKIFPFVYGDKKPQLEGDSHGKRGREFDSVG